MGSKNSKLLIFASTIVGATFVSLFAINVMVDKISKKQITPASAIKPPVPKISGTDDKARPMPTFAPPAMDDSFMPKMPQRGTPPGYDARKMPPYPPMMPRGGEGNMMPPSMPKAPQQMPPYGQPNYPPREGMQNQVPPNQYPPRGMAPPDITDEERKMIEEELERRRQLFESMPEEEKRKFFQPPPDGYDEEDYDYEGRNDIDAKEEYLADVEDNEDGLYEYEEDIE